MKQNSFLILEDNQERIAAMQSAMGRHGISLDLELFTTAPACINWLREHHEGAALISLDHHLEPSLDDLKDPGTGRDVANWLALQEPAQSVMVHSSNYDAALGMECVLEESKYTERRVTQYDDLLWICKDWINTAKQFLSDMDS